MDKNFEDLKNNNVIPLLARISNKDECKTVVDSYTYAVQVKTMMDVQNLLELNYSLNPDMTIDDVRGLFVSLVETYDQLEEENFSSNVPLIE